MKTRFLWSILIAGLLIACAGDDPAAEHELDIPEPDVTILAPSNNAQYTVGDVCTIKIKVNHPDLISDLELWVDDTLFAGDLELVDQDFKVETKNGRVGHIPVYLKYMDGAGKEHRDNRSIVVFSDIIPDRKEVNVVNTYPHDGGSYTQGMEFYKGSLYEGTGRYELSKLAEVDLKTGAHIRAMDVDDAIFGEGITIMNDTLYQISYRAGKCFLYDVNSFEKIGEFDYQGEGWGLCNNGESIIMSNGDSKIVWRDRRTFEVTKSIEIFDNQSSITNLNELELIDGNLFANIYTDTRIAIIDTANGKVLSYLNCAPLANAQDASADVINGIAQNKQDGKIYVTGKLWKFLYEISYK